MAQQPIEIILARQLASCLAVPTFIVNSAGSLLYLNEAAEGLLGVRLDELEAVPLEQWTTAFEPRSLGGDPLPGDALPLVVSLRDRRPAHAPLRITSREGVVRSIEVTSFPIEGTQDTVFGAVAMFWESLPE